MSKPTVSICTPTYNRRFFIPALIKCFKAQKYPQELIEWIIVDDGDDPVGDLFKKIPNAKYFYYKEKLKLGRKRNIVHSHCKNEIIIYMDDDDYYPPDRIKEAVLMLNANPKKMIAGSSKMLMYYTHCEKIYSLGPYGKNHATAGTFAFRRKLLDDTSFDDNAEQAEEKHFLKNYSYPMIQLDPIKTILVISHNNNTFDKKQMIGNERRFNMRETNFKLKKIIRNKKLRDFYKNKTKEFFFNKIPKNIKQENTTKEDIIQENTTKEDSKQENTTKENIKQKNIIQENTTIKDIKQENITQEDIIQEDIIKKEITKEDSNQ
tara:strand:+ start:1885 stop:2844 length:960 start_codon:yes stop_codon:yes gene_type:complete